MVDMLLIGKKVYVKIRDSTRYYSGVVLKEDDISITIKDLVGHVVFINKADCVFIQEEK